MSVKKILLKNARLVLTSRVFAGDLSIEGGIITHIRSGIAEAGFEKVIDLEGSYVLPGFIDIHNHGAAGFDFSFGRYDATTDSFELEKEAYTTALEKALHFYLSHGVTQVLLTTMAAPLEKLEYSFSILKEYLASGLPYHQLVGGINLEGTFLKDPLYAGAQNPKFFYEADWNTIIKLQKASGDLLRIVNVPPEHGQCGLELISELQAQGIVVAGGHTAAYGDEFQKAVDAGLSLAVHFFNGPSRNSTKGFRQGGAEQIILKSDQVSAEIICDGYHVHPSHVRDTIVRKEPERVIMITDSMFANGMDEVTSFSLFGLNGAVSKNREYLQMLGKEDTLFGSVLASDRGFSNVLKWLTTPMTGAWVRSHPALPFDTALPVASSMFSGNPARLLNIFETENHRPGTGSLDISKWADLLVGNFDATGQLNVEKVFVRGEELY